MLDRRGLKESVDARNWRCGRARLRVDMSITGQVSRAMLPRYWHVRMEAKRRPLDEVAARQRAADEEGKKDA